MTIGLIGDSTVAVQSGWGPAFARRFNERANVLNYAKNGATLESLSRKLDALLKLKPDYVLIQFGHNDQKRYDTNVYSAHLKSYVDRIRKAGGKPIVVSSVVRRTFGENGQIVSQLVKSERFTFKANLTAYAKAAQTVAEEVKVPFIDLHTLSAEHHNTIGVEASMAYNFKKGDKTHFNKKGGEAIAGLVIPELVKIAPELSEFLVATNPDRIDFEAADASTWKEMFSDDCTGDWTTQWFLDGEIGTVKTGKDGMTLTAGPEFKNDAHHMVLWTKQRFKGDLKIEFDYTRLDTERQCVTILYIQATGSGKGPYSTDISTWNDLRKIPSMRTYFNHMNAYHISYAAFPNQGTNRTQYIRGRRYMPEKKGLKGTDMEPDYVPEGLFATGVKHRITVIKTDRDLFMRIENPDQAYYCHLKNPTLPIIAEGRIGLRHMYTRSAMYKNFKIYSK